MKIALNNSSVRFKLSPEAMAISGICEFVPFPDRTNERLIAVIEELGDKASCDGSKIEIVDIPDGTYYVVFPVSRETLLLNVDHNLGGFGATQCAGKPWLQKGYDPRKE